MTVSSGSVKVQKGTKLKKEQNKASTPSDPLRSLYTVRTRSASLRILIRPGMTRRDIRDRPEARPRGWGDGSTSSPVRSVRSPYIHITHIDISNSLKLTWQFSILDNR